jgi:pimeloyl-ACP methyl ester carboxylesterase
MPRRSFVRVSMWMAVLVVVAALVPPRFAAADVSLPAAVERALIDQLGAKPAEHVLVESFNMVDQWAFGAVSVHAGAGHEHPTSLLFIAHLRKTFWEVALETAPGFAGMLQQAPQQLANLGLGTTFAPRMQAGAPELSLPWSAGETQVLTGGAHGGSREALDFSGGSFQVRAAHDGVAYVPCANQVVVYHPDGWRTGYYHLTNIAVQNNQSVSRGQVLGTESTGVGCGGSATGPHVHFWSQYAASSQPINGSVIGGWTVQAGQNEYQGCMSKNGTTRCAPNGQIYNDGTIGGGGTTPVEGILVRDDGPNVERGGPAGNFSSATGWTVANGHATWTYSVTAPQPDNFFRWKPPLDRCGDWEVYAFIPWIDNGIADTANAAYEIKFRTGMVTVVVDQGSYDRVGIPESARWKSLGVFPFSANAHLAGESVTLGDNTGEGTVGNNQRSVNFDDLRWVHRGENPAACSGPPPAGQVCPDGSSWNLSRRIGLAQSASEVVAHRVVYEGSKVWLQVDVVNTGSSSQNVDVTFELGSAGRGTSITRSATVPANGRTRVSMGENAALMTDGLVRWNNYQASGELAVKITTNKCSQAMETRTPVKPRPVILVHGYTGKSSDWADARRYLDGMHIPSYAVEGLKMGDSNDSGAQTNTVAQNVAVLRDYVTRVQRDTGAASVDVLAHSMGGLVTRNYIHHMMPTAPRTIRQLIMLGTPNGGSPLAYAPALAGRYMPASTELLPSYWEVMNRYITERHGVRFRLVAGSAQPFGMMSGPDDCAVTVNSARAIPIDDANYRFVERQNFCAPNTLHSLLRTDQTIFEENVRAFLTDQGAQLDRAEAEGVTPATEQAGVLEAAIFTLAANVLQERSVWIDGQAEIVFNVGVNDPAVRISLRDPRGQIVDLTEGQPRLSADPLVPAYSYRVAQPVPGEWAVIFESPQAPAEASLLVLGSGEQPRLAALASATIDPNGGAIVVTDTLETEGSLAGLQGEVLVIAPSGERRSEPLAVLGGTTPALGVRLAPAKPGVYTFLLRVTGTINGRRFQRVSDLALETTPPETSVEASGQQGVDGWYVAPVTVVLTATDYESGVGGTYYRSGPDREWTLYNGPFTLSEEGPITFEYRSIDRSGNVEAAHQLRIKIDTRRPVLVPGVEYDRLDLLRLSDVVADPVPGSGLLDAEAQFEGQALTLMDTADLFWHALGTYTFPISATDRAGWELSGTASFTLVATIESLLGAVQHLCASDDIDNRGICTALTHKLNHARQRRDAADIQAAARALHAFINQVEAQAGQHISDRGARILISDAQYATLDLNGEVLVSRMYGAHLSLSPGAYLDVAADFGGSLIRVERSSLAGPGPRGYVAVSPLIRILPVAADPGAVGAEHDVSLSLNVSLALDPSAIASGWRSAIFGLGAGSWQQLPLWSQKNRLGTNLRLDRDGNAVAVFAPGSSIFLPMIHR